MDTGIRRTGRGELKIASYKERARIRSLSLFREIKNNSSKKNKNNNNQKNIYSINVEGKGKKKKKN